MVVAVASEHSSDPRRVDGVEATWSHEDAIDAKRITTPRRARRTAPCSSPARRDPYRRRRARPCPHTIAPAHGGRLLARGGSALVGAPPNAEREASGRCAARGRRAHLHAAVLVSAPGVGSGSRPSTQNESSSQQGCKRAQAQPQEGGPGSGWSGETTQGRSPGGRTDHSPPPCAPALATPS